MVLSYICAVIVVALSSCGIAPVKRRMSTQVGLDSCDLFGSMEMISTER